MLRVERFAGETQFGAFGRRQRLCEGRQFGLVLHSHIRVTVGPEGELILGKLDCRKNWGPFDVRRSDLGPLMPNQFIGHRDGTVAHKCPQYLAYFRQDLRRNRLMN